MKYDKTLKLPFSDTVRTYVHRGDNAVYLELREPESDPVYVLLYPHHVKKLRKALRKAVSA